MRDFALIFGISLVVNYCWELLQAPLYIGMRVIAGLTIADGNSLTRIGTKDRAGQSVAERTETEQTTISPQALERLLENRKQFLGIPQKLSALRLRLRTSFKRPLVRSIEKSGGIRDEESVIAWLRLPQETRTHSPSIMYWPRAWPFATLVLAPIRLVISALG